ncbi:DNA topoisomerase [Vibrio sp. THAF190c]|uniref:DNA topoisomerase n=1 Tax=Vibrio sp. THAF190c TaxID=2587865 RepID=UPI00126801DB|nr:DNA topoisomerase [Vibrio sp. THAF190c]QFT13389.1 DNA topoisomerase 3 [Vibrio sp. THAF190c]
MDLYVCEKPEVAKHLSAVLSNNPKKLDGYFDCGNGVIVTWAIGHLLALKDPEDFDPTYKKWDLAHLPLQYGIEYKPNPKTRGQLKTVMRLLKQADRIYASTDIDAAGQSISDEVMEYVGINPASAYRVLIDDNNPQKLAKALSNVKSNADYQTLFYQEKARSIADQRLGYNLTRLLSCQAQKQGFMKTLYVGRVQSAILGLVVRRELSRKNHQKSFYYNVTGEFVTSVGAFQAKLKLDENHLFDVDEKGRLSNKQQVGLLTQSLHGRSAVLTTVENKQTQDSAPLPFDLLTLQVECSRYFGMSPDEVLDYTQKLREGPYYAITYNRSDCRYCPDEAFSEAPEVISNLAKTGLLAPLTEHCNPSIKSRAFNSSKTGAHGGIIPTGSVAGFEEMPEELKVVFLLICRNYLIQFYPKRERHITEYQFLVESDKGTEHYFNGRSQSVINPGWSVVFQNDAESDEAALDDVGLNSASQLQQGECINSCTVESQEKETKPLPSYTNTTLLKDLQNTAKYITDPKIKAWMLEKDADNSEQGGIGTAATRSGILKGLFDNRFIEKVNSKVLPTEEGNLLYQLLPERITSPETTAIWSHFFKSIGEGSMDIGTFLTEVDRTIEAEIQNVKRQGLNIPKELIPKTQTAKCPHCKQDGMKLINGKFGAFWTCSNCEKTAPDLNGKPFKKSCPECRKPLKVTKPKDKKKKPFISCSGYKTDGCTYKEWT